jgi:hypothetical protein
MNLNFSIAALTGSKALSDRGAHRARHLFIAATISIIWVIVLCAIFNPRWETNDDVAMSMVAHGYGIADYGSPRLFFSNVVWGLIVRSLPSIDGVLGYSIATLMSLVLAGAAIVYFLLRVSVSTIASALVLIIVLMRPILFPQFTVTAGLLAVAAVLGLLAYQRNDSIFDLVAACSLAFFAYLIRDLELALVTAAALPLLDWRKLAMSRAARLAIGGLAICIAGAAIANIYAYSPPEWQTFRQQNSARAPLTDFAATKLILERPELLQSHGLSKNDIQLVGSWFFVDPRLSNPELLRSLVSGIPQQTVIERNLRSTFDAIYLPIGTKLFPLTLVAAVLLIIVLRVNLFAAWAIAAAAVVAIALAGRYPLLRVYYPLLALLISAPFAMEFRLRRWTYVPAMAALVAGIILNGQNLIDEAAASSRTMAQARQQKFRSSESTFVWGGEFPFEDAFPLFTREDDVRSTRIYGLGVLTLAPFSVATADERANRGLLVRLRSEAGIPLIAGPTDLSLLNTYCMEHYGVPLRTELANRTELWTVRNASCPGAAK